MLLLIALAGMITLTLISFPEHRAADECSLPELLRSRNDLRLFIICTSRAGFLGNPASLHPLQAQNYAESIIGNEVGLESRHASSPPLTIPRNFERIYIRRFVSTVIAIRRRPMGRRILAVPESKKDELNGLEEVALEPLSKGQLRRRLGRRLYLSDLLGDSLAEYPRRIFVDVGAPGRACGEDWFARKYPTRGLEFEIIRVDVDDLGSSGGDGKSPVASGGVTEWMWQNVGEEEYVVMKAEADAVEEMVKGGAIGLVDELFLECPNQWQKGKGGKKSRRAYWECLALYGKLRDEGVAVHQWWD
ncbi:hypothetical protein KSP40_PGU015089 [Platanthera guangdongensis]|uniref:DUF7870 domain-containing protein n=1 Tax=Platanthera guangdongensis TaxID=2320717 RepID=A0ABR2MTF0_9ASPA